MVIETCKYTKDHEWVKEEGGLFWVGITDHAQSALGEVVFVDLPKVGRNFSSHETFGVVESIKAVSDLYCPVSGEVVAVNDELVQNPSKINEDPYGSWMLKLKITQKSQLDSLMDANAYKKFLEGVG